MSAKNFAAFAFWSTGLCRRDPDHRDHDRVARKQLGRVSGFHRFRWAVAGASALLLLVSPLPAVAGTQNGVIRFSSADQTYSADGVVTIILTGAAAVNRPACATEPRWALNLDNSKVAVQYIYALILTAMSNGWQVTVTGTGACSTVPYIEDIAYVEVNKQ